VKFSDAFRETVHRFNLKGSDLAQGSGLTNAQVSNFRNGQNLRIDTVEKLLAAMPQEAREYMLSLVATGNSEAESLPPKSSDGE
jgi:transcriptional regulator with XRE-family HTH domain